MEKKWARWLIGGLMAVAMGIFAPHTVSASDSQQAVPLRVSPVVNQYQATQAKNYYDLEMKPGQKTELQLRLGNVSAKTIHIKVQVAAAGTSEFAQIDYSGTNTHYDSSMKYPLTKLIEIPQVYQDIAIPTGKTAVYHFPLTMPAKQFDGYILGQINIRPAKSKSQDSGLASTYSYGVGVKLSNGTTELPTLTMPGKVVLTEKNRTPAVNATLRNPKASMLRNGTLDANVTKQGQNRVLKSVQFNQSAVAPNSRFTFQVPWKGAIAAGDYTLHTTYKSTDPAFDQTKVWKFEQNFHVSAIDAARYTLASYRIPWWAYAILIVIILLLIIIIWLLLKRKKEAKASDEEA